MKICEKTKNEVKNFDHGNYIGILWFNRIFFHHESYKEF